MNRKQKFVMPHVYLLIIILIGIATVMTYIVPAGTYDFVELAGKKVIDPSTFHYLEESTPVGLWQMICSIPNGLKKNCEIVFLALLMGSGIAIVNETKALDAFISKVSLFMRRSLYVCVPVTLLAFGLFGQIGALTAPMAMVPLGLLISSCIGGDACVAIFLVIFASNTGFACGAFSAPNTGIAQTICGLPAFSGSGYRLLCWFVFTAVNSIFLIRYIRSIQKDPTRSVVYNQETAMFNQSEVEILEFNGRRIAVCLTFLAGICVLIYGSIKNWSSTIEIPMVFVVTCIACGVVYGYNPNKIASLFVKGIQESSSTAAICGIAAGIGVVLTDGNIIHTVVHALSNISSSLPVAISAIAMFFANLLVNVFILSGSGQAAVVMPIFSPLAQVVGMTQQTAVLAFNFGDGLSNAVLPTSAATMAGCGIARVPFDKWIKFIWKHFLVQVAVGSFLLVVAVMMNYGPF